MLRSKTSGQLVPAARHVSTSPVLFSADITGKESFKTIYRRIQKAERDERIDLTTSLTPVRTYRGGFTRPTDIRASNWFKGGRYHTLGRHYEEPSPFAYEPHTVFLLESRYDIKYEVGRPNHPAHIVAVCRASDFEAALKVFNSPAAPSECITHMDNACWPWKPKKNKSLKWWTSPEDRLDTLNELGDTIGPGDQKSVQDALQQASKESDEEELRVKKDFRRHLAQTAAVAARVEEEQRLSDIRTEIKPLGGKIPFELEFEDGTVAHPSGFVPPTPAEKQYDPEYHLSPHPHSKIAIELRRRQKGTVSEDHSDSSGPKLDQWKAVKERKDEEGGLMSNLTSGLLSGGVSAATEPRDAKIPTEIHGVHDNAVAQPMQHPSGFVPPTARMSRGETDARTSVVEGENEVPPEAPHRSPTFASSDTDSTDHDRAMTPRTHEEHVEAVKELRQKYLQHIKDEPFWRPLIALTVSTRPIAKTLARLSRGLSQGRPFYSIIPPDERKSAASFAARLRSLRVTRMRTLATEMAQLFAGARGGPIGVRFDVHSRGRGIEGEGLDKPIPWNQRVIGVGIGQWYPLADELAESFRILGDEQVAQVYESNAEGKEKGPFLAYRLDDRGRPLNGPELPWPEMDMSNDHLKLGIQAFDIIHRLERIMECDPPPGKSLSVLIPAEHVASRNLIDVIADHRKPITVRFAEIDTSFETGEVQELREHLARAALRRRIDGFYGEYKDSMASAKASRAAGVMYPPTLSSESAKDLLQPTESYQFTASDKQWFSKIRFEEDRIEEEDD